ncbi:MAG TPA: VanZ family protein [Steroidobacteraceae bacterium]
MFSRATLPGRATARSVLLLLLFAAALITLVLAANLPSSTRYMRLLNDAGHAPVFGALAWIGLRLAGSIERWAKAGAARYFAVFAAVTTIGILVEVVQSLIGRDATAADVLTDAAGAACVLFAFAFCERGRDSQGAIRASRAWLLAGALGAAATIAAPLARGALAYAEREAAFPHLIRFGHPLSLYFVETHGVRLNAEPLPARWANEADDPALRVQIERRETPAVMLVEPKADWSGYELLALGIINPGPRALQLTLRVHDQEHNQRHDDRFNMRFVVAPASARDIAIPLEEIAQAPRNRSMDLTHIAGVVLFESSANAPVGDAFYITHLTLR